MKSISQFGLKAKAEKRQEVIEVVTFSLGEINFAINIQNVQGINRMGEITKLPDSLPFVEGIINLRGAIIPLINLRKRLGLPSVEFDKATRFVVIEIQKNLFGFIVDRVNRVLQIPKDLIEPTPKGSLSIDAKYVVGIAKLKDSLIILLDLEKILSLEEIEKLSKINN